MKIAIAGAGVAGSYLGCSLQKKGHDVTIFESSKKKIIGLYVLGVHQKTFLEFFQRRLG
jgi:2-polyprenyl-6-methoxyphenol hydroxylase-like FAD-dependent oxidoreductase